MDLPDQPDDLDNDLDMLEENPANKKKTLRAVHELRTGCYKPASRS